MPLRKLKEFLDSHNIKYVTIGHSQVFTAQEIAATVHIPGKELAKTVMVKIDDKMGIWGHHTYFCLLFGFLPAFLGFKMRPSVFSRFSTKLPLPRGRPVFSCFRISIISSSRIAALKKSSQLPPAISSNGATVTRLSS